MVEGLLGEGKRVREERVFGQALVEVGREIGELEVKVGIGRSLDDGHDSGVNLDDSSDDNDDENDEDAPSDGNNVQVRKLQRYTTQYNLLQRAITRLGSEHPFLQAQRPRMEAIRRNLLSDLGTALKLANATKAQDDILAIVRLFGDLGGEKEGVRALRGG